MTSAIHPDVPVPDPIEATAPFSAGFAAAVTVGLAAQLIWRSQSGFRRTGTEVQSVSPSFVAHVGEVQT
ncbi:hypothetical protein [Brevundimonas sp.]|uniref:hypothetical protein n=1 Tax=Brevundimonas sp. TaxID=1871086 RepID=UPI00356AF06C